MAGFTVLSRTSSTIVVEDYRVTISIPMTAKLLIPKVQDIATAEEFFIRKREMRAIMERGSILTEQEPSLNG